MAKLDITPRERSALRAAAHPLRPIVLIGDHGLSDSVLKEIDRSLTAHQLIKIRAGGEDREAREAMLEAICDALSCAPIHHLGKTLIIYRPDPKAAVAAKAAPEPATRAQRKPSQPHTPKKQAAAGQTRTRSAEKAERAARKAGRADTAAAASPKARRASPAPSHGIPRRPGSALSLRAGARRGLSRSSPKR